MNFKRVFTYSGAFIAFLVGSGFATGQEVLQYFASYGYFGIIGTLVVLIILVYAGISFITKGYDLKFRKGSEVFKYYCGEKVGTFFDYFSIVFIYLSFIVMVSGAGANINQHFNLPNYVGSFSISVLTGATVMLGLGGLVKIIGKIGPAVIILSIFLGMVSTFGNVEGLKESPNILTTLNLTKASSNWFLAAGSYAGFCMLWLAGFLASIGSKSNSRKEIIYGVLFGAVGFSLAVLILTLGLMSNIKSVAGTQIPTLVLAEQIHPYLATVFSIIIIVGIYSASVPLLWSVSSRFAVDKSLKFNYITIILTALGLIVGTGLDFSLLVNVVYVISGYIGMILLLFMLIKTNPLKKFF